MPKHADGPASGRMGFGYAAAKEAGVPWNAIRPRSEPEIRRAESAKRAEKRKHAVILAELNLFHPKWRERRAELLEEGKTDKESFSVLEQEVAEKKRRRDALEKAKRSGSV